MAKKMIYTKEELLPKNVENDEQVREMVFLAHPINHGDNSLVL